VAITTMTPMINTSNMMSCIRETSSAAHFTACGKRVAVKECTATGRVARLSLFPDSAAPD
jgi:hypothetical protein